MESRYGNKAAKIPGSRSSTLPLDYLQMVATVFSNHFDRGLKIYSKFKKGPRFEVNGEIYGNEIVLAVSLLSEGELAATTVYTSCDFDPKASAPNAQDLLAACVDAAGTLFGTLLDPENKDRIEQLAEESLSAMDNIPFEWAKVEVDGLRIFLKVDKSNPKLDELADEWLAKNDPGLRHLEELTRRETEKLFVTGEKAARGIDPLADVDDSNDDSGTVH